MLKHIALLLLLTATTGCLDPMADVPIGTGEAYIVYPAAAFSGRSFTRGPGATPQFCPVRADNTVPSCARAVRIPVFASSNKREVTVGDTDYIVLRTSLPAPGRYAFFRAYISTRSNNFRTTSRYFVEDRTTVFSVQPNSVVIFPEFERDQDALRLAVADGAITTAELRAAVRTVPAAQSQATARAAVQQLYGPAARSLTYTVGELWEATDASGSGFRLVKQMLAR